MRGFERVRWRALCLADLIVIVYNSSDYDAKAGYLFNSSYSKISVQFKWPQWRYLPVDFFVWLISPYWHISKITRLLQFKNYVYCLQSMEYIYK